MIKAVITAASVKQKRTRCGVPEKIRKSNAHATIEGIVEREREISTEKLESNYNTDGAVIQDEEGLKSVAELLQPICEIEPRQSNEALSTVPANVPAYLPSSS